MLQGCLRGLASEQAFDILDKQPFKPNSKHLEREKEGFFNSSNITINSSCEYFRLMTDGSN